MPTNHAEYVTIWIVYPTIPNTATPISIENADLLSAASHEKSPPALNQTSNTTISATSPRSTPMLPTRSSAFCKMQIDSTDAPQGGDIHRQHHSTDISARIIHANIAGFAAAHYSLQCQGSSLSGGPIDIYNTTVFLQEASLMPTMSSAATTRVHT